MSTETITEKDAKDGTEFEEYPVYSMAVLWSMEALRLNEEYVWDQTPVPVDGDALARSRASERRLAASWEILEAVALDRLRNNHHEIDRSNR